MTRKESHRSHGVHSCESRTFVGGRCIATIRAASGAKWKSAGRTGAMHATICTATGSRVTSVDSAAREAVDELACATNVEPLARATIVDAFARDERRRFRALSALRVRRCLVGGGRLCGNRSVLPEAIPLWSGICPTALRSAAARYNVYSRSEATSRDVSTRRQQQRVVGRLGVTRRCLSAENLGIMPTVPGRQVALHPISHMISYRW